MLVVARGTAPGRGLASTCRFRPRLKADTAARRPISNLTKLLSLNLCGVVTGFGYDPYEMGHVRRLGRDRRMESANEVGATSDDETKFCNTNRFGLLETLRAFQDESVRGPPLKRARQFSLTPCF